jgi:hypothetical protein
LVLHPDKTRIVYCKDNRRRGEYGQRAIKILGYSTKKITTTDPATGEEVEDRVVRYPMLSVFDISQTDREPVPSESYQLPTGAEPAGALDQLSTWFTAEGWSLQQKNLAGGCEGYTDHQNHVIVTAGHEPAARLAVLLHEAAHADLHGDLEPGEY